MSDTAKRDAVLNRYSGNGWDYPDHEAMAWRIVELEAAEAERDRLTRILAALREPSEAVVEAALNEYDRRYSHGPLSMRLTRHEPYHRSSLTESLSAAVAAAEQEVGRE